MAKGGGDKIGARSRINQGLSLTPLLRPDSLMDKQENERGRCGMGGEVLQKVRRPVCGSPERARTTGVLVKVS